MDRENSGNGVNRTELRKLSADFGELLQNGRCSDVVLKTGEKQLKAHKLVLSTRSPVFAAMFEHDCKEKLDSSVEITDVSGGVLEALLRYIYTGQVQSLDQFALELITAADKVSVDNGCSKSV